MEKGKRAGWGGRLVALLLALCLAACLPSALAEEYAEPNAADGWEDRGNEWWLNQNKVYTLPFESKKSITIRSEGFLTAPSITVNGTAKTNYGGSIDCAGTLKANQLSVNGTITTSVLECDEIHITDGSSLVVRDRISCSGEVYIGENGMLILPGNTTQEEVRKLNTTGDGRILVGTKTYDTEGNLLEGASIYLTDGIDVSDEGFDWNSETCTLTLTDFTRNYVSGKINTAGIFISAPGKAVTLVLNGENKLTELGGGMSGLRFRQPA